MTPVQDRLSETDPMERRTVMMKGDDDRRSSFRTEPGHPAFLEVPMEELDDACAWLEAYHGGLRAGLDERGANSLRDPVEPAVCRPAARPLPVRSSGTAATSFSIISR
jgi:hypothetical protein